jgi:molybdate transport system substrate-binding protein
MSDTTELKLLTSNSMRGVLHDLIPELERTSGMRVAASFDPAKIMLQRIAAGETADLAILGQAAIDELTWLRKLVPGSQRTLARCGVGIGVRAGAPKPDVSTVDALKRVLLDAKSVAYTSSGASGIHFAGVIERLGIANEVKAKAVNQPGGLIGERVANGDAEIAIQQIPELMAVPGVELVGPLPQALQNISVVAGGVFADSKQRDAAQALLASFSTPASARVFRAKGLEPA